MTSLLAQVGDEWIWLDGDEAKTLSAYPTLKDTALVVSDFGAEMLSGGIALEGNPVHAPALINRRLTTEGATDGESRVLIHAIEKSGHGYMASYSAIALARWQRMADWSGVQAQVCLVIPLMSLLWNQVTAGRGVVAQCGRHVRFLARIGQRILHCETLAFSETQDDLEAAVHSLAARVKQELAATGGSLEAFDVTWYTVFARSDSQMDRAGDGADNANNTDRVDRALAQSFFAHAQVSGSVAPSHVYRLETTCIETSLTVLLDARSFLVSVSPLNQRVSWALERWARSWSFAFLLVAICGLGYGGVNFVRAHQVSKEQAHIEVQTQRLVQAASALEPRTAMPANYDAWAQQLLAQRAILRGFDVNRIVGVIGAAAQASGVRVLRIYTVSLAQPSKSSAPLTSTTRQRTDEAGKALVVDGTFAPGADNARVTQLAHFVDRLHASGFDASPVETTASRVDGNLLAEVFTYRLNPVSDLGRAP